MDRFRQEFNFRTCCFYKKNRSNLFLSFEAISQNVDIGYLLLPDIVRKVGFGIAFKCLFRNFSKNPGNDTMLQTYVFLLLQE